ncbi:TIM-barrel domain-containing protein [Allokutzneria oryzae]|uniref:TIM-barrel domain-containing protein n=1 Tax=Allokutzneria oryzae TaxID=1378989 RepID=A0ABV5ZW48_9PSEU
MKLRRTPLALAAVCAVVVGSAVPVLAKSDGATITSGSARFEVLSPTLIRMEYAADRRFEDRPTFNAVNRGLSEHSFSKAEENGSLVIRTGKLTLRYRLHSGPFSQENLRVDLVAGTQPVTARPAWDLVGSCDYGKLCEAETQRNTNGAVIADEHRGFTGRGYVAGLTRRNATIGWTARKVPAGRHSVQVRYANAVASGEPQTMTVTAGETTTQIVLPPTGGWANRAVARTTVELPAGASAMSVKCTEPGRCGVDIDSVAVTPVDATYPEPADPAHTAANLGGWRRSLDEADGPRALYEGLLSRDGWYLLNDSETGLARPDGGVDPRPKRTGDYQDGYFFGYGHDYRQGLRDLRELTGPAMLLPRWTFGNWYSRYFAHSDADYRDQIVPGFRANKVPLDALVVDTDFKAPNKWNGWDWDPKYFPDPKGFFDWAHREGIRVSLNIHPSIATSDPRYAEVRAELGRDLRTGICNLAEECRVFDLSDPAESAAYFNLHRKFEEQGVDVWWPDSCCDGSMARGEGISPDSVLNAQYAKRADSQGKRGFSWNRSGSGFGGYGLTPIYPAGPWADHRYTVDTSMDTTSTWELLSFASYYTVRRGNIGMPYESHDIGAHNFPENGNKLPEDLYARWVQFGTFQPLLRLHSNHGVRLPWDYADEARDSATKFLQLREALVPYTYSLARQAHDTGLPMTRGMYLNYPAFEEAYRFDRQYLYGDDVLVAPVVSPGMSGVSTDVWFPPGTWIDYFTGKRYSGPGVKTVTTDLSTMPVLLRGGSILPTRTDYVDHSGQRPLDQVTLDVATGGFGSFSLYEDAGDGNAYREGEFAQTEMRYTERMGTGTLTIMPRTGSFPGMTPQRTWTVNFRDVAAPRSVSVAGAGTPFTYDNATRTLTVKAQAPNDVQTTVVITPR